MHALLRCLPLALLLLAACAEPPAEMPDANTDANPAPVAEDADGMARVFFVTPADGATVPATFPVEMGVAGYTLAPAGTMEDGTGHLHILIDTDFIAPGQVIPNDAQHRHYGDASTEAELTLTPGPHTLRLQFANGAHIALEGEPYRDEVRVTVAGTALSN